MLIALIGGGVFVVISYVTQLVHPGSDFNDPASAAFEIAGDIGGNLFSAVFLAGLVVTQFASGIAAQTSVARLLYAMGRDNVLPAASSASCTRSSTPGPGTSCFAPPSA